MKRHILTIVLTTFALQLFSQVINYNVLPTTGRAELFHTYLLNKVDEITGIRKAAVTEALTSKEKVLARQQQLRKDLIMLLGPMPAKTDLNPTVVGTIDKVGYKIERLHFQSIPNHHVTGNLYIPTTGTGPFPAVVVTCGHYPEAKGINVLQGVCVLLATNGIAALIVEPIEQGERNQILSGKALYFAGGSGTSAHTMLDVGASLAGTSVVAWSLWDNHRAVDYLYSRPELIDTSKIGVAGGSGGGAQATYLSAFDSRIKAAVVVSYLMDEPTLFKTIGPQTGSQNLSYEGQYSIDHPEFLTMFAPKPFMILAAIDDFFDIIGTRATYAEAKKVYQKLDAENKVSMLEFVSHDWDIAKRQAGVRWFKTWFLNDTNKVVESAFSELSVAALRVTTAGQVMTEFTNEINVTQLNIDLANSYKTQRESFWSTKHKDTCLTKVKELIKYEQYTAPSVEYTSDSIKRKNYSIKKLKITSGADIAVTGLLFVPNTKVNKMPAVLYVDGRGKGFEADSGKIIEKFYVDSGKIVLSIDVRGFGETTDNASANESKHNNNEHRNAVIAQYVGKTLIGQRVADIKKALDILATMPNVDASKITMVGIDRGGILSLHAAALDSRVKELHLRRCDSTFMKIVENPLIVNNMTNAVPNALRFYDLPDLRKSMSPRNVKYIAEPVIPVGIKTHINQSRLDQNYPNPFCNSTTIPFSINTNANVTLILIDNTGRRINLIDNTPYNAGDYKFHFNNGLLKQGIYFYQLITNDETSVIKKMTLIK